MTFETHDFEVARNLSVPGSADHKPQPVADGGHAFGPGFCIAWQRGPVAGKDGFAGGQNGAYLTSVLAACLARIIFYQRTAFASDKNARAAGHISEALAILNERLAERDAAGVLGTHERPDLPGQPHGPTAQ